MNFPTGQAAINMFIQNMEDYLNTLEKDMYLLFDDCHLMEDSRAFSMLFALCDIPTTKLHIILVPAVRFCCTEKRCIWEASFTGSP